MKKNICKNILIALSLANILFAGSWRIFVYPPTFDYHIKDMPSIIDYLAIVLAVIITAGMFLGAFYLFKYLYNEKADFLINFSFFVLFLMGLNIFRLQFEYSSNTITLAIISQIIFLVLTAVAFTKYKEKLFNFAKVFVLVLSPFVLITFSQAFLGIINNTTNNQTEISVSEQLAKIQPTEKKEIKNRVVWLILDEFDYRLAFESNAVELPEFERLKEESLWTTNAKAPAYNTLESIPSLLTGKKVKESIPYGQSELILKFSDDSEKKFSKLPNIFSDVKALNGNTAIDGFYHAYCRVLGETPSVCSWIGEEFEKDHTIFSAVYRNFKIFGSQFGIIFATDKLELDQWFSGNTREIELGTQEVDELGIKEIIEERPKRFSDIYKIATDPNIDLAYIHLPVPHPPARYDLETKKTNLQLNSYVNNLVLADEILGDLRKVMEKDGQWENSTLIVSTDHHLRVKRWLKKDNVISSLDKKLTGEKEDERIPFFVKMKGQKESVRYDKPLNTIISRKLIVSLLKGEISSTDELAVTLDNLQTKH